MMLVRFIFLSGLSNKPPMQPLEHYETPDGIVIFSVPSSEDSQVIWYPCVELVYPHEVFCNCHQWCYAIEPMLKETGLKITISEPQWHCHHIRNAIKILTLEGRIIL